MKRLLICFTIVLALLVMPSCQTSTISSPAASENQSSEDNDIHHLEGKSILRMDLTNVLNVSKAGDDKYYMVYEDITKSDKLEYITIDSTDASLVLNKGDIYVVGIAKKVFENGKKHIKVVGVLGDDYYGLRCIPVGESATEVIDLGKLVKDGEVLKSTVSATEFADMLGYDEELLKQIAIVDITFQNFLNPDIDRDGVFDSEESFKWYINTHNYFYIEKDRLVPMEPKFEVLIWTDISYLYRKYGEYFKTNCFNDIGICVSDEPYVSVTKINSYTAPLKNWRVK